MRLEVIYDSQVTNRREGGFTSCGCNRKLLALTYKELETVRAAQKLLATPTIGGGECLGRGWWWWRKSKELNTPPSCPECMKTAKNGWFPALIDLKIAKDAVFYLKVLNKIYSRDVFEEYINLKKFYLR
jgi:hypothetical protein